MGLKKWLQTHHHHWVYQDVQPVLIKGEEKKGMIRVERCFCGMYRQIEIYPGMRPVIRESIVDGRKPEPAKQDRAVEPGAGAEERGEAMAGVSAFQGARAC